MALILVNPDGIPVFPPLGVASRIWRQPWHTHAKNRFIRINRRPADRPTYFHIRIKCCYPPYERQNKNAKSNVHDNDKTSLVTLVATVSRTDINKIRFDRVDEYEFSRDGFQQLLLLSSTVCTLRVINVGIMLIY